MENYLPRVIDEALSRTLASAPAVLVEGPVGCGKTTTAMRHARTFLALDDPDLAPGYRDLADIDPGLLLRGEAPLLVDEWQLAPATGEVALEQAAVKGRPGQFILSSSGAPASTASAVPSVASVPRLAMRPLSLFESGDSTGEVSLGRLFGRAQHLGGSPTLGLEELAFLICRGGWPHSAITARNAPLQRTRDRFDRLITTDISRLDGTSRDPQRAAALLAAYANAIGTQAGIGVLTEEANTFANTPKDTAKTAARTPGATARTTAPVHVSPNTARSYLSALTSLFELEDAPAWTPALRTTTPVRTSPTHYFTDPSMAAAALGLAPEDLPLRLKTMARLFENLCIRDLRIYAEAIGGRVCHYRDKNGLECDAVVQLDNGAYGLVEIRLGGERMIGAAAKSLTHLAKLIDTAKMGEPAFRMVLVGVGKSAYRRPDGILVVPVGCLGD